MDLRFLCLLLSTRKGGGGKRAGEKEEEGERDGRTRGRKGEDAGGGTYIPICK